MFGSASRALVGGQRFPADIEDRPLFTYTFTYTATDSKTSVVLDTGKVTAIDGNTAAGKIAKGIVARWVKLRQPPGQKRD